MIPSPVQLIRIFFRSLRAVRLSLLCSASQRPGCPTSPPALAQAWCLLRQSTVRNVIRTRQGHDSTCQCQNLTLDDAAIGASGIAVHFSPGTEYERVFK
ncbi:hypothetical protein B0T24DRAFT_630253 [Lasiosphaeria ovina]|uniref:Secreted protein n=1 Tax=Lasiosphaeria ovina TaxID=92902 RepID=A0AAE0N5S2_9PEZI|nr:hypothetical protein B0T24DRAFT_630253 [Lasiosphaeria ovina]